MDVKTLKDVCKARHVLWGSSLELPAGGLLLNYDFLLAGSIEKKGPADKLAPCTCHQSPIKLQAAV